MHEETRRSTTASPSLTREEIGGVVDNLALNAFTNYFNVRRGTEHEWPFGIHPQQGDRSERKEHD